MTKQTFEQITAGIRRAASQQRINLAEPANTFTVWLENPRGSGEYALHARAANLDDATRRAGRLEAVIRTTDTGRVHINVWKDGKWLDGYADERPIGGV